MWVKIEALRVSYTCPKTKKKTSASTPNFVIDSEAHEEMEQGHGICHYATYRVEKCPQCGKKHKLDLDLPEEE